VRAAARRSTSRPAKSTTAASSTTTAPQAQRPAASRMNPPTAISAATSVSGSGGHHGRGAPADGASAAETARPHSGQKRLPSGSGEPQVAQSAIRACLHGRVLVLSGPVERP
jgi:hypothetical protein